MLIPLIALASLQPQPSAQPPLDWAKLEAPLLTNHKQLTFRDTFVKAGENYFSHDGKWIIFQAVAVPEQAKEADPYYAMYIAKLDGDKLTSVQKVSPPGSANTCGWFHPTQPQIIFGSTVITPKDEGPSGYQRGSSRYRWAFPAEMDIVTVDIASLMSNPTATPPAASPLFSLPNYDAECSFDKTGRFVLYAHIEDAPKPIQPAADAKDLPPHKPDANIYIYDTKTKKQHPIVVAPGYDGGPFFSPSGEWICYRSDRRGNDELQLFVAKLKFTEEDGVKIPTGIETEYQITDNAHVNWCPFFHPSGDFLIYGSSQAGHDNYEVFAIKLDHPRLAAIKKAATPGESIVVSDLPIARITHASGADVLPVFSPDGTKMLWCSQRGPKLESEPRPSSQIWIADWNGLPFKN